MKTIGVLAVQGCVDPHLAHFQSIGVEAISIRYPEELKGLSAIVLPGGESTTMLKLLHLHQLFTPLKDFLSSKPAWGICAGSILLAKEVENPAQESLGVARICAVRNAYGSQLDSFQAEVDILDGPEAVPIDFIRAPRLSSLHESVSILASYKDDAVMLRDRHLLCSSFHTELGDDSRAHEFFVNQFVLGE